MDSTVSSTFFFKNGSTAKFRTGSVTFEDGLNVATVMIANDTLLEAMADYLSKQDADTLARFVHLFSPRVLEAHEVSAPMKHGNNTSAKPFAF